MAIQWNTYPPNVSGEADFDARSLVNEKFSISESLVTENAALLSQYLNTLEETISSLRDDTEHLGPQLIWDTSLPNIVSPSWQQPETILSQPLTEYLHDSPEEAVYDEIIMPDEFTGDTENIEFFENAIPVPDIPVRIAPGDVTINPVIVAPLPDVALPVEPVLGGITLPSMVEIGDYYLDILMDPIPDLGTPVNMTHSEEVYSSDIKVSLFQKILNDIEHGGTGLSAEVEQEIYNRGTARQQVENERLYNETVSNFSGLGWELPTGAFASAIAEIQKEISRKNDQNSREIMISQAELEQKNIQFSVTQATQIESALMEFFNQRAARLQDASKTVAAIGVEIFNALVAKANLKIEKHKAEVAAYEAHQKGDMAKVSAYEVQMKGVAIAQSVDESKVDLYGKQIEAVKLIKEMHGIDMERAKIESSLELAKLDQLKLRTEIFVQQIVGDSHAQQNYLARIEAEKTRAGIFSERIRAENLRLEGKKLKSDVQISTADLQLKNNSLLLETYKAKLEGEKTKSDVQMGTADLQLKNNSLLLETYKAKLEGEKTKSDIQMGKADLQLKKNSLSLETYKAKLDGEKTKSDVQMNTADLQLKKNSLLLETYKAKLENRKADIQAIFNNLELEYKGARIKADTYDSEVRANAAASSLREKEFDRIIRVKELELTRTVETLKADLNKFVALNELEIKGREGINNVQAQIVASALNCVNASASLSASASESGSIDYNYSKSVYFDTESLYEPGTEG